MKMETFDKIGKKLDFVENIGIFHTVMLVPACGNTVGIYVTMRSYIEFEEAP